MSDSLKTTLGSIEMANPVTVASGTFGLEYSEYFDLNRLGALVSKTVTRHPKEGNPTPRLFETEAGMLNSIGLQNPGVEVFVSDYLPQWTKWAPPLLVSFSGSTIDEFCEVLEILEAAPGIAGYEVNISCPNVENEGIVFGTDPAVVKNLVSRLAPMTRRELMVKLSPNVTDIVSVAKAAKEGGATSLALINTLMGMAVDPETGLSRIRRGVAGYSGTAVKPVALQMVWRVRKAVDLPLLGMGGIENASDALEFLWAGASAIALGTALFVNPTAAVSACDGIERFINRKNLTVRDIIGKINGIE